MESIHLHFNYASSEKPIVLLIRRHDLGGLSYENLVQLSLEQARLFVTVGITFLHGEPDWNEVYGKIVRLGLEEKQRRLRNAKLSTISDRS